MYDENIYCNILIHIRRYACMHACNQQWSPKPYHIYNYNIYNVPAF